MFPKQCAQYNDTEEKKAWKKLHKKMKSRNLSVVGLRITSKILLLAFPFSVLNTYYFLIRKKNFFKKGNDRQGGRKQCNNNKVLRAEGRPVLAPV